MPHLLCLLGWRLGKAVRRCSARSIFLFCDQSVGFGGALLGEQSVASRVSLVPFQLQPAGDYLPGSRVNFSIVNGAVPFEPGEEAGPFFDNGAGQMCRVRAAGDLATACPSFVVSSALLFLCWHSPSSLVICSSLRTSSSPSCVSSC